MFRYCITGLIFLIVAIAPLPASGMQNSDSDEDRKLLRTLKFDGNKSIGNGVLRSVTRTQTNREIFGIPGATLWQTLHGISSRIGEAPRYLDREIVGRDIERLKQFYEANGFFDAVIDTSIVEFQPGRMRVTFHIEEGEPSYIRTLAYSGIPEFEEERTTERFYSRSNLGRSMIDDTTMTVDRQYSVEMISEERMRIIDVLRREGYASVQRDSIRVLVRPDTINPKLFDVLIRVRPGIVHYFGDLRISLESPETGEKEVLSDTLRGEPYTIDPYKIVINRDVSARTRAKLLRQRILFKPGERFDNDLYLASINQYQTLEMLSVRQFSLTESGGLPDYSQEYLPVSIDLLSVPRHQIRTDFFGMQRLGFGAGAGVRYSNNNVFRNAERLEVGLNGSFEYISSDQILRNVEASLDYGLPFFAFPFGSLNSNPNFLNPQTRFRFSVSQINQINFNINANFRFNMKFEANHSQTTKSFLDLIELEWYDATATTEFRNNIFQNAADTLQALRILEDFNPQFSSTTRYTFRNTATHMVRRDQGFFLETSLEVGGTLPYLIEEFIIGRDSLQSTIPSFSLSGQELNYSQYVKSSFDYRRYHPLTNSTVFAWRGFAGVAYPFGKNPLIPLNRRYFGGGANDIRGWNPLELGPGDVPKSELSIIGGDIKLAGFMELRHTFSRNFLSTNWIVALFTDVGNVWYGPRNELEAGKFKFNEFYKQLAVGSGLGLRLDWEFVILRIDLAYRIHDLGNEPGTSWWNRNTLHFGIGHSF